MPPSMYSIGHDDDEDHYQQSKRPAVPLPLRSQRPRRQAATHTDFSYAERPASLSPEPQDSYHQAPNTRPSRPSNRKSSIPAGSVDVRAMASPSSRHQRTSSSTPSDTAGEAPLTRTGRPSRALKGKKVHKCDICGRVYTRNEHLRRHQLNHSSEILPCPLDGCQKAFSRADLLKRHIEEHNDDHHSFNRRKSSAAIHHPRNAHASPNPSLSNSLAPSSSDLSTWPSTTTAPFDHAGHQSYPDRRASYQQWDPSSSESSPTAFPPQEDNLRFMGVPAYDQAEHSDEFFPMLPSSTINGEVMATVNGSASPLPPSPGPNVFSWPHTHQLPSFASPANSDTSTPYPGMEHVVDVNAIMPSGRTFFDELDSTEQALILKDVEAIAASIPEMQGQTRLERLETECLEAFWYRFDPIFSVIHRRMFETYGMSPLVRALMIALGAHLSERDAAQAMARTLRDSCGKIMQRRPALDYSRSRLCDLQAVFLYEVLSIYCSRRPSSRFSQRFEDLVTGLMADRDNICYSTPLTIVEEQRQSNAGLDGEYVRIRWFDLESKRRLLLSCYVLETQQNAFFGSHRPISDRNLPVPCSQALWQAYTFEDWQMLSQHEISDPRSLTDMLSEAQVGMTPSFDPFLSSVVIAHSAHAAYLGAYGAGDESYHLLARTAQCQFAHEAARLATSAPISDLLSVSGETFMLGQKLATQEQYEQAISDLRVWASSGNAAASALAHARRLFQFSFEEGRCGLMHEEWALTLAALVLWAVAMWPKQYEAQQLARSAPVDHAEEMARAAVYGGNLDYVGARACLAYARRRMEGRLGWLVQDACGTLGKLVEGRIIDIMTAQAV